MFLDLHDQISPSTYGKLPVLINANIIKCLTTIKKPKEKGTFSCNLEIPEGNGSWFETRWIVFLFLHLNPKLPYAQNLIP